MTTVLLVEDSRLLRVATERVLSKAGYTVICACDGDEARALAASQSPDLIVLDMLLPKLSGQDVLRYLKNDCLTAHIPVIVCSGLSQKNEAKLLREGACAYVVKGSILKDPDALLNAIKTEVAKKTLGALIQA